ncbi:MAG: hypothetical protein SFU98_06600 [Leptospiraceae bacterium]|nr:hypothetical protein [Leptospiraceae bacterium]
MNLISVISYFYSWWIGIKLNNYTLIIFIPDNSAILCIIVFLAVFIQAIPLVIIKILLEYFYISIPAIIFLPSVLFTITIYVSNYRILYIKQFCFFPYWIHRVPNDAELILYEAWEDERPTGVAFKSDTYEDGFLHFGTERSADGIIEFIAQNKL